jgi:hypothetical protein
LLLLISPSWEELKLLVVYPKNNEFWLFLTRREGKENFGFGSTLFFLQSESTNSFKVPKINEK